jgi:LPXTG-motif cell wall-anchored protein
MRRGTQGLAAAVLAGIVGLAASAAAQTQTTSTEVRKFTVVAVEGNTLVARDQTGTREYKVPADTFRFTVGGKQLSVAELKPGMTGTATITTTTTVTPVTVTEVKNGTVVQASGGSVLVRTDQGFRNFTEGEIEKRGVKIIMNGRAVEFSELRPGNKLSATIITEKPPQVLTERQVVATITPETAAAAGLTGATAAAASTKPATPSRPSSSSPATPPMVAAPTGAAGAASLPKTASNVPLLGVIGFTTLALAMALTLWRRQRVAR